jgi:hypothetical protein
MFARAPRNPAVASRFLAGVVEHDPEKWERFSEKIMLIKNARAPIGSSETIAL